MGVCERCWAEARRRADLHQTDVVEEYDVLIAAHAECPFGQDEPEDGEVEEGGEDA